MDDIVYRVLAHRISIGVEETEGWKSLVKACRRSQISLTEVAARVDSKSNLGSVVVDIWGGLCTAKRTGLVRAADVELVIVTSESSQVLGFNLRICGKLQFQASQSVCDLTLTV